jgi:polyisoprenoid-binding protein YceI
MLRTMTTQLLDRQTWQVDPSHSSVGFAIRKLGAGTVHGRFNEFEGVLDHGGTVRVASIATGNADRDAHLLAPGIFAADEHPLIGFEIRRVDVLDDGAWRIAGALTIRDRTRPVELVAHHVTRGEERRRLRLTGQIDRRDFGLTWNRAIEATGAVGSKVRLELDLELSRPPA